MTRPTSRRLSDGTLTDDVTDAARAAHESGEVVDHDALERQARTAMQAWRSNGRWPDHTQLPCDVQVDLRLARMATPEPPEIERLAFSCLRTYNDVRARWMELHS